MKLETQKTNLYFLSQQSEMTETAQNQLYVNANSKYYGCSVFPAIHNNA